MTIKVIIMGVGGVGKSAITNRFVIGRWIEKYDPTIEESYQTTVDIDGKALQVEILDTAGQDAYTPLRETFMHTGDGFMLVYSVVDDQTLEELRDIREQILRVHRDRKVPILIVGNKIDMPKRERVVSKEEGKALASEFKASYIEVSAKDNKHVKDAFDTLVRKILSKSPKAGQDATDGGAGGVFGGGKAEDGVDEPEPKLKKSKSSKSSSAEKAERSPKKEPSMKKEKSSRSAAKDSEKEKEEKGKCLIL